MAISLTTQYLPQSVLTGDAFQALLDPFVEWGRSLAAGAGNLLQNLTSGFRSLMEKVGTWLERDEDGDTRLGVKLAGWIDNLLQISKWKIGDVNLGKWAQESPFGFGAAVAGVAGMAILLTGGAIALVGTGKALVGMGWIGVKGFIGFAKTGIGKFALGAAASLGGLVRWGVGGTQRIWQFNWNQTDEQIRAEQKSRFQALAGRWGEALGASIGTLCGFTLGRVAKSNAPRLVRFNPRLLADLKELEFRSWEQPGIWEEAIDEVSSAINDTISATVSNLFLETYLQTRKFIKAVAKNLKLQAVFPQVAKHIEKWGAPGSEPWSFAIAQEKIIESIPSETWRNFTEEFVEAAQDMCAESTVLVSYALG